MWGPPRLVFESLLPLSFHSHIGGRARVWKSLFSPTRIFFSPLDGVAHEFGAGQNWQYSFNSRLSSCSCVCSPDSGVCCHLCIVLYYASHVFMLCFSTEKVHGARTLTHRADGMRSWGKSITFCVCGDDCSVVVVGKRAYLLPHRATLRCKFLNTVSSFLAKTTFHSQPLCLAVVVATHMWFPVSLLLSQNLISCRSVSPLSLPPKHLCAIGWCFHRCDDKDTTCVQKHFSFVLAFECRELYRCACCCCMVMVVY